MTNGIATRVVPTSFPIDATMHPDDPAIEDFVITLRRRMADGRARGRAGWQTCPVRALAALLWGSVETGRVSNPGTLGKGDHHA
ncbi:MAG: hypothetical protein HIU90_12455 [Proteobacteria bacterium]|nr:hypothetical protein [Pseudomonadota bacterium]